MGSNAGMLGVELEAEAVVLESCLSSPEALSVCVVELSEDSRFVTLNDLLVGTRFAGPAGMKNGLRSGLQRLHARKPSRSASCGVEKKTTLARLARREGQVGRQ